MDPEWQNRIAPGLQNCFSTDIPQRLLWATNLPFAPAHR